MSKVFITQESSSVDYTPATEFGDLVFVTAASDRFSPHVGSYINDEILDRIKQRLADFTKEDYLICTGAPTVMAICGAVLGERLTKVLVWDSRVCAYHQIDLRGKPS